MVKIHQWTTIVDHFFPPVGDPLFPDEGAAVLYGGVEPAGSNLVRTIAHVQFTWDPPDAVPLQVPPDLYWTVLQYRTNTGSEQPVGPADTGEDFVFYQLIPLSLDYIVPGTPDPFIRYRGETSIDVHSIRKTVDDNAPTSVGFAWHRTNADEKLANTAWQFTVRQLWEREVPDAAVSSPSTTRGIDPARPRLIRGRTE